MCFGGKLKDTVKPIEIFHDKIVANIDTGQAYKIELDNEFLFTGIAKNYFNAIEKVIDTKCVFVLLECMPNIVDTLNKHSIYPKADFIISNNSTVGEFVNRLLERYKQNEIPTDINVKELKTLITNNLKTEVYKTDEICLQYMYSKSIKSYISSNKKSLDISDIPVLTENDNTSKKSNKQDELSKLVGLEYIKDEIDKIIKFANFNQQARKNNHNIPKANLNMCFLGKPGTGKTTVARLIAKEFHKNGIIKQDKVTEILPNDLMGEYVGQTRRKTRAILDKAKDGILFIDEAYQIASTGYSKGNPFMQEALTELLKYMENPDNIIIFAGYKQEIENMINMNPGIKSRITTKLEFKDYETEVLKNVLDKELETYKLRLDLEANEKVLENIEQAKRNTDFGNCRYVKNLAIEIVKNYTYTNKTSKIIKKDCVPTVIEPIRNVIGFR